MKPINILYKAYMVVYEVKLQVDKSILDAYMSWLKQHMQNMLSYPGFISAQLCSEITDVPNVVNIQKITARYELNSKEALNDYLTNHAQVMRREGIDKFGDKFSATRRAFEVLDFFEPATIS